MTAQISRDLAQQIVEAVKEVCQRDINYINPDGEITASTDPARIGTFHSAGKRAAREERTIEIEEGEKMEGTQPGVNIPLFHEGELVCVIGITGEPGEVRRYAYLASRITQLFLKEQSMGAYLRTRQEKREYAVRMLIGGGAEDPLYLEQCLEQLHARMEPTMTAARIVLGQGDHLGNISVLDKKITDLFAKLQIRLYRFRYPSEYMILFPSAADTLCRKGLRELAEECAPHLAVGIGSQQGRDQLPVSWKDAVIASQAAVRNRTFYEEYSGLDLEILLSGLDQERKRRYLQRVLDSLQKQDRDLLLTYFSLDMSLTETAKVLHLHKNTLQYKLNRIRDLCGYNPRNFRDAALLYLALRIQEKD